MKSRPSFLQKIWRKVRRAKPAATVRAESPQRKVLSTLEPLEGRIAPAALINPTTLMFHDTDGDIVTVKFTKPLFTSVFDSVNIANASKVFTFTTAGMDTPLPITANDFDPSDTTHNEQLRLIDVTQAPTANGKNLALGTGITITVVKAGSGNGQVDVGYIRAYEPARGSGASAVSALEVPLAAVSVAGDLGQIDAGSSTSAIGLASLKVKTLGARLPADTQPAANATTLPSGRSLTSTIIGGLGALTVSGDVKDASILVINAITTDAKNNPILVGPGNIASVTIAGSLRGGTADQSGLISAAGKIGAVKVGTLLTDGIFGGAGEDSGEINSDGAIASLTVNGSIKGGTDISSGLVHAATTLGPVLVKGSLEGGTKRDSGAILAGSMGAVTLGGSIKSGGDTGAGTISSHGAIGLVKITGDIDGTVANTVDSIGSGGIHADGKIAGVTVVGLLKGGSHDQTGFIDSGSDLGPVFVAGISGGSGQNSGTISAGGKLASVTVMHDVLGGSGVGSGAIFSGVDPTAVGDMGAVKIGGRLVGAGGDSSGSVNSGGKIASVTIGPSAAAAVVELQGGAGNYSGSLVSRGAMGAVKITGDAEGGGGIFSGSIWSRDVITAAGDVAGDLGAVVITGHLQGGSNNDSGAIRADGKLASVTVGEVTGGAGVRSGSIRAGQGSLHFGTGAISIKGDLSFSVGGGAQSGGIIAEGKIASVLVSGSIVGGTIRAGDDIGSITVTGDISAGTNPQGAQISARGQAVQGATTDLAIGKVTVLGNVSGARIRAGYDTTLTNPVNPDAQIGAVYVKGNWTGSDLFAGVIDSGTAGFGIGDTRISSAFDSPTIISQISSIIIGGTVSGGGGVHRGFVAQKIVAMKVGTATVALTAGQDTIDLVAGDVTVLEVS